MTTDELKLPADDAPDEQVSSFLRGLLPDFYFVNTPLSRMRRHLQLLRDLPANALQIELNCPPGAQFTELILCGYAQSQPGLLAQIAGVLALQNVNVHTAWIHTLRDPYAPALASNAPALDARGEAAKSVVLNTFILSENSLRRTRPLTGKSRASLDAGLRAVIGQERRARADFAPAHLKLDELSVTSAGRTTLIKLSAPNETGVLHLVAQAVAHLNLDIAHAQINTFEDTVADTFFVTDAAGQPLAIDQETAIAQQLGALLSS